GGGGAGGGGRPRGPSEVLAAGGTVAPGLLAEVSTAAPPPRVIGVYRLDDLPGGELRPVALELWGVADPGNLGTLIRSADAFGAAVVLKHACADPTGPQALRASAGSIWRVPLGGGAGRRVALVAHGGSPLAELDLRGEVTFLLGAERAGLPPGVPRDLEASIPIVSAESLNVAAAGAVALYEWRRQNP